MKITKILNAIILLILISCSSKKTDEKIKIKPQILKIDVYEPSSVCDCSKDGIKTLNKMLKIRQRYQSLENFNDDLNSVESISLLKENWNLIREKCLRKFATKLFAPTECNKPEKITELRGKLDDLKVSTS